MELHEVDLKTEMLGWKQLLTLGFSSMATTASTSMFYGSSGSQVQRQRLKGHVGPSTLAPGLSRGVIQGLVLVGHGQNNGENDQAAAWNGPCRI